MGRSRSRHRRDEKEKEEEKSSLLYVRNLSRNVNDDHLKEIFGHYGDVRSATISIDKTVGLPKGYAYVEFNQIDEAEAAKGCMHEGQIDGSTITVTYLKNPKDEKKVVLREASPAPIKDIRVGASPSPSPKKTKSPAKDAKKKGKDARKSPSLSVKKKSKDKKKKEKLKKDKDKKKEKAKKREKEKKRKEKEKEKEKEKAK